MGKYAVAYMNYYDNDLVIEVIEAEDWKSALFKHSAMKFSGEGYPWKCADNIEVAKQEAFNGDFNFDVKEI